MTFEIPLTRGFVAVVDPEDHARLAAFKWRANVGRTGIVYGMRTAPGNSTVMLHRAVLDAPAGVEVDHVNRDGLDCRRANLRFASVSQNQANRPKPARAASSRFKGVTWDRGRWRAYIRVDRRRRYLGFFAAEADAARAYDRAALAAWGAFARLNLPEMLSPNHDAVTGTAVTAFSAAAEAAG